LVQFIPFIDWLAALASVTLLIVLWDEIGGGQRASSSLIHSPRRRSQSRSGPCWLST
jgi:hypothetical protein